MNQITPALKVPKDRVLKEMRAQFPVLSQSELGQNLSYLDNAATTLKPQGVIEAIRICYADYAGPVHRGLYPLADAATYHYEKARQRVCSFLNAADRDHILFTPSATQSLNMVAEGWAKPRLKPGDVIYVSRLEHHANYLPWQRVCQETGAVLKQIELRDDGALDLEGAADLYDSRTKLIALCHISNVTGIRNPVEEICSNAKAQGIAVMLDCAQSVCHEILDVQTIGCDFLAFSAHKMFGPTGSGVLYAHPDKMAEMEPFLVGGGMVDWVGNLMEETTFSNAPARFETGSQNLAGAVGLAAAIDFLEDVRTKGGDRHVHGLTQQARLRLEAIEQVRILPCPEDQRTSILSFDVDGVHPHDVAQCAGEMNVALRAGHHCAQPLMRHFDLAATNRASFSIYNHEGDIEALYEAVVEAIRQFG